MIKRIYAVLFSVCLATSLFAANDNETAIHRSNSHSFDVHVNNGNNGGGNDARGVSPDIAGQLSYYGGPTLSNAKIVMIFWGTYWNGAGSAMAQELTSFRDSASGLRSHFTMLSQYNAGSSNLKGTQADIYDSTEPPTAVSDSALQAEVKKWFHGMYDGSTIYEVFLPPTSYGVDTDTTTSCGGPNLGWCAYHGSFADGPRVYYSMEPYPSCSGCSGPTSAGWDAIRNAEHFMTHETREAMTDAQVGVNYAWRDLRGYEADDKCAWGGSTFKTLFIENAADGHTYGYQMEYSNAVRGCVK